MAPLAEKPAAPVLAAGRLAASWMPHCVTPWGAPLADGLAAAALAPAPDAAGAPLAEAAASAPMLPRWTAPTAPLSSDPPYSQTYVPSKARAAAALGRSSAAWSLNAPSLPFLSRVDFQTVVVALPPSSQPPTTRSPSVTGTAAAPLRGCGSERSPTGVHVPSAPEVVSRPKDHTVLVALPSGPRPPSR